MDAGWSSNSRKQGTAQEVEDVKNVGPQKLSAMTEVGDE